MAANQFYNWLYGNRDDELQNKLNLYKKGGDFEDLEKAALIQGEMDADTAHHQQELMNIAATSGASSGGTGVEHGQGMPYAQSGDFRDTQPTSITKREEDEWKKLRAPGFGNNFGMKPFRMYS